MFTSSYSVSIAFYFQIPPEDGQISYSTAKVPPSKFPERKFCSVCGFPSPYTCVKCGLRYCSGKCLRTHEETRSVDDDGPGFDFRLAYNIFIYLIHLFF